MNIIKSISGVFHEAVWNALIFIQKNKRKMGTWQGKDR